MKALAAIVPLVNPNVRSSFPQYFGTLSLLLLALMVFVNVWIAKNQIDVATQFVAFIFFSILWLIVAGFNIRSLLFAAIGLGPAVLFQGIGYLPFPGMALTPSDVFMVLAITAIIIIKGFPKFSGQFSVLLFLWFCACLLSALLSTDIMSRFGGLVRMLSNVLLVYFLVATRNHQYKRVVFYGIMAWPFVAFAHLIGMGLTWDFISVYRLGSDPLTGSSNYIKYYIIIIPFFLMFRVNKLFIIAMLIALMPYIIFASSRSLLIGLAFASGCFILFLRQFNQTRIILQKTLLLVAAVPILFVGAASWQGKTFLIDWNTSLAGEGDFIRVSKMQASWYTFLDNPVLGLGFGQVDVDSRAMAELHINLQNTNKEIFRNTIINYSTSAESTPFQIIAELGFVGAVLALLLISIGVKSGLLVLRNKGCPFYLKISLLCFSAIYVADMIGGNRLNAIPFISAVPVIFYQISRKMYVPEKPDLC